MSSKYVLSFLVASLHLSHSSHHSGHCKSLLTGAPTSGAVPPTILAVITCLLCFIITSAAPEHLWMKSNTLAYMCPINTFPFPCEPLHVLLNSAEETYRGSWCWSEGASIYKNSQSLMNEWVHSWTKSHVRVSQWHMFTERKGGYCVSTALSHSLVTFGGN